MTPLPENPAAIPYGVRFIRRFIPLPACCSRLAIYRASILTLTYIFYVSYHLARRPMGVVKNVLKQSCANMTPPPDLTECELRNGTWCAWEPFDKDSQKLFSALDFTYRFSYAVGMIFAGHIAERTDLRIFITWGMILSGAWAIINGMAYFWKIHFFSFFLMAQLFGGIFQGTGWPSVVPLMGNWFGKHRLGFIFGVWNSHTSVGNILGAVIAGVWVNHEWGYSFIVPGLIIAACGVIAYLFVVVKPEDVGLPEPDHTEDSLNTTTISEISDISLNDHGKLEKAAVTLDVVMEPPHEKKPITMMHAIKIPGVIEFSLCLFFSKAVYYTFFFWLPVYIKETSNGAVDNHAAADLSAVFDAGGIIGGILAGALSDATGGSATVSGAMFILAIPSLYLMILYVSQGLTILIVLLVITGLFVNGPYALITTAVSTDLGTRPSLTKNTKALATVAGVIDGMGSLGSAFGPLVAGLLSTYGWQAVFYFLIIAQVVALLCLTRLIYREIVHWCSKGKAVRKDSITSINGIANDHYLPPNLSAADDPKEAKRLQESANGFVVNIRRNSIG
ncbi:glucose-6-phosphate exchanger SLC37A2-like isoform X2 [Paramacrobiotus metropolitanus]|nr:glucose-6-phosphate exchanger SLC37A2-like isoform X2 [Paramacrobiotus metropolitanus]